VLGRLQDNDKNEIPRASGSVIDASARARSRGTLPLLRSCSDSSSRIERPQIATAKLCHRAPIENWIQNRPPAQTTQYAESNTDAAARLLPLS